MMCAFESAAAAVSCAVSIQQRFDHRNRTADEQLTIRAGISMGDATPSAGDYFGIPVIEAARLCDRASGGQIISTEMVAHLVGARGHEFRPLGGLELKGLPQPLSSVEVAWTPLGDDAAAFPLPPGLTEAPPAGFVGREAESERLAQLFAQAKGGERRLALLAGEPGIGKTRLATQTAIEVHANGAAVLFGRCSEELAIPYGPWVEALGHYVAHAPGALLRSHAERHGGEVARIAPALRARIPDLPAPVQTDPETERYLLWGAVAGLLSEASEERPLVVLLDDLHWTDKPTLQLLKHVLTHGEGMRTLIIAAYRHSDIGRGHPLVELLADLNRIDGVKRISLHGLGESDVRGIMERSVGHSLDEPGLALAHDLFRETGGNPFYTGEVLRHLTESGRLYEGDGGHWTVRGGLSAIGLPQSIREVVGRRVERLGEATLKVLSAAAVIGREFDSDLLQAVSGHNEDELLDLLEEAVTASVLIESASTPGRFSFFHALINHTLYEELGTTRLARLHRRTAEALEQQLGEEPGARVSELAHHWAKASSAVDLPKAISYAGQAGERALAELAPGEGVRWFTQGLELQDRQASLDPAKRCDLLIGLGEAQLQTGNAAFRETLLGAAEIASQLGDGERAARAALANNRGLASAWGQIDAERITAIERALELCGPDDLGRSARLLALQAMELIADADQERRHGLANEALARARQAGDPRTLGYVLRHSFEALRVPETLEQRLGMIDETLRVADQVEDPALRFWALNTEAAGRAENFEIKGMDEAWARESAIAEELAQPFLLWLARSNQACSRLVHGDLAEAEKLAEEALRIGTNAEPSDSQLTFEGQIGLIRVFQGRGAEVIEMIAAAVTQYSRMSDWRAGLASSYCWLARWDEAASIVADAAKDNFDEVQRNLNWTCTAAMYAEAAFQVEDHEAAAALYEMLEPWGGQLILNGTSSYGPVHMYLGMLASTLGLDEATDSHFAHAHEQMTGNEMPLWEARNSLGWADSLSRRGKSDEAYDQATKALALAKNGGYGEIERRAAAVAERGSPADA
jgi:hypothetical protein